MKKKFVGALALASTLALAACSNGSSENVATTKYGNVTKDDLVNTEPFSDIEIPELFDNELAPILQLVAMFTNSLNVAA